MRRTEHPDGDQDQRELQARRNLFRNKNVARSREHPHHTQRIGQDDQWRQKQRNQSFPAATSPKNRYAPEPQPQGKIVVGKSHVKCVAVGNHRDGGHQIPRRALRRGRNQGKDSPKENQHGKGNDNFSGDRDRKESRREKNR